MAKDNIEITELIVKYIKEKPKSSSNEILMGIGNEISIATLKRILKRLVEENIIVSSGKLKGTKYEISIAFDIIRPIDILQYFEKEIDDRNIHHNFNHTLIGEILNNTELYSKTEQELLNDLQEKYTRNVATLSDIEYKKELERLAIDLSWKSSQIEGNTYSLLETERLLKDKETASGKTKDEAVMLLNHKEALDFIIANTTYIQHLTVSVIEDIHSILMKDLGISRNIRNRRVGISGTNYRPLENEFQIKEALEKMCFVINNNDNVFSKALLSILLISYIQPFTDGNKRTARIISNAILINNNYCPISFRTIDSIDYKKAMLVFYEQNNIYPFKQIFINQFNFAVNTYF